MLRATCRSEDADTRVAALGPMTGTVAEKVDEMRDEAQIVRVNPSAIRSEA